MCEEFSNNKAVFFEFDRSVILIQPSCTQIYRTTRLDLNSHGMLTTSAQIVQYKKDLVNKGYVEASTTDEANTHRKEGKQWFIVLRNDIEYHCLNEMVVFNILSDDEDVHELIEEQIRLKEMGEYLFIRYRGSSEQVRQHNRKDRGNYRADIGFGTQCITTKVLGMNAVTFCPHGTQHEKGLSKEEDNLTSSIISGGVGLTRLIRLLVERHGLPFKDYEGDPLRTELFSHKVAKDFYKVPGWKDFRMEGLTYSITGSIDDNDEIAFNRHTDSQNSKEISHSAYWNASSFIIIVDNTKREHLVRVSLGVYGKVGCDYVMIRMRKYENVKLHLEKFMQHAGNADRFVPLGNILKNTRWNSNGYCLRVPHSDKSVYYSIFIDGMLYLRRVFGNNLGAICEAVWLMGTVRCPDTWHMGVIIASRRVLCGGKNLVIEFFKVIIEKYGKLSCGEGARRVPSYNNEEINLSKIWKSLRTIHSLIMNANNADGNKRLTPKKFVKEWTDGVYGAGKLIASEQIHVLTMMNVITNHEYIFNIGIAENTATGRKLKDNYGVQNGEELIQYLSINMNLYPWVIENMICESLKDDGKVSPFCDVLVYGQCIYEIKNGQLIAWDVTGASNSIELMDDLNLTYKYVSPNCLEWWGKTFNPKQYDDTIRHK